jgi:ribosomal protein S18 acetylase RimI-like enzyme
LAETVAPRTCDIRNTGTGEPTYHSAVHEPRRTRSEYRGAAAVGDAGIDLDDLRVAEPTDDQRESLARLMLAAYRDTVDDEGEDLDDAREAIDHYLASIVRQHSFVAFADDDEPVAFSFVVVVDGTRYVDPVVVAPACQGRGIGRSIVSTSLRSLAADGIDEVGATITDGNVPSERLFARLGFRRVGPWPPAG